MEQGKTDTRNEESFKNILSDFNGIEEDKVKEIYSHFREELERGAAIHDFIPILAEKSLRNYLREHPEFLAS